MRWKVNGSVMFLSECRDALIYDKIASQPQQIKPGMSYQLTEGYCFILSENLVQ